MATSDVRTVLTVPEGYRSRELALSVAMLDDQLAVLKTELAGITTDELAWQPAPGLNTIGMLLAHLAIVEVFWMQIGPEGVRSEVDTLPFLGIGIDDDGMPIPEGASPPIGLAGRDLGWYLDLIGRGRDHVKRITRAIGDQDLATERTRTRRNGSIETFDLRWMYYHLVEHFAGHYGQILLLRHQYRVARAEVP